MNLMRLWEGVVRSSLLVRLLACLLIGAAFVPMAEAGAKRKPKVLIVHNSPFISDIQSKLNTSGQFGAIDLFNAGGGTPTLAALKAYDAVMIVSDTAFADSTTLGNNLADYVDAGGGVVNSVFSLGSVTPPAGRWNSGYLVMPVAGQTQGSVQTLDLASITDQNHPILIGVGSFNGGSSSFRMNQSTVVAGATIVAKWTGGNVLVAAGPLPGRVDLNFYSPSKDARVDFWDTSTDGIKLMVNSLLYVMRPKVLLVYADSASWAADVQTKVKATNILGQVDLFDGGAATPTLAQLQNYDAVLVWSDSFFANPSAMGNVMADFVDAGGGVVTAVFANGGVANSNLQGRWTGTYDIIPFGPSAGGAATLGAIAYASHPIMNGVVGFNGGSTSFRPSTTAINPGGLVVAKWSDGKTLAAVSTKMPNRADLGMFPPSSAAGSGFWVAGTTGDKLMANALLYTAKPYVLVATADQAYQADPVSKLTATRRFSGVGSQDLTLVSPPLSTFSPYNAVITWTNNSYLSAIDTGNNLANYVDAGGGVVVATFANTNVGFFSTPQGRWPTGGYDICPTATLPNYTNFGPQASLGAVVEPGHPIAKFVRKFDGGTSSYRGTSSPLLRGRTIMKWSDGNMLASAHNFRKRADLGIFPPSNSTGLGNSAWNQRTDGTWLMANALEFVVRAKPCPGDFNGDGQVDDADFVLFAGYYDTLTDPRGDLTGDGNTEDSDFVIFANSYDTFTCP